MHLCAYINGYHRILGYFLDSQVKLFKKDIDSLIDHMSNDIVNKEQSAVDEFRKNINNSVSYLHIHKKTISIM